MKPIQQSLNKLKNNNDFSKRYNRLIEEVMKDKDIQDFVEENKTTLTEEIMMKSLGKLYEYKDQIKNCHQCIGYDSCQNLLKGFKPVLFIERNHIDLTYEKCEKKRLEDEKKRQESMFESMYIPEEIQKASMANLFPDKGRMEVVEEAIRFIDGYSKNEFQKGLYLHGSFGVGKTYILAAIANELAKKNVHTLLVYMPEFMREIKSSLKDQSFNHKIDSIKKVPVLMIDDIGAESMSSWFRDDVLGTILQYRMMERLPVFFSSNLNFNELQHHFTYSQRGEEEGIKAARIMERIKFLSKPINLIGKNYRQ